MQNITIGRYSPPEVESHQYGGWIEGVRNDGTTWIMFLGDDGNPQTFFAVREPDGGVVSDPVVLDEPTFATASTHNGPAV